jgi:chemotaxis response regulator CheB
MTQKAKPGKKSKITRPDQLSFSPGTHESHATHGSFPIVGIGASAGGLKALELFLANAPANSGMAFTIDQPLDPTHKGIPVELLQRSFSHTFFQVRDRMRVKENGDQWR